MPLSPHIACPRHVRPFRQQRKVPLCGSTDSTSATHCSAAWSMAPAGYNRFDWQRFEYVRGKAGMFQTTFGVSEEDRVGDQHLPNLKTGSQRDPRAQPLQNPPDQAAQDKHNLTHVPYQAWCPGCVSFRAHADAHRNTGVARSGSTPRIASTLAM